MDFKANQSEIDKRR